MSGVRSILAILVVLAVSTPAIADEDVGLEAQLRPLVAAYQGKVVLYAADSRSGKTVAIDADIPVPTASVIKLAVLFEALKQIQDARAHFEDRLTLTKGNQVEGSGVLTLFDTPLTLTLKDALTMMVVVSDNTATNLVIDHLGLDNIDRRIAWLGLHNTWLYKKVFLPPTPPVPPDEKQFGLGKTTAREMASLMQRFATCDLSAPGSPAKPSAQDQKLCDTATAMLKNQSDRDAIPRYLGSQYIPDDQITVANKTGSLDDVRNDVAIVYARNGPVIISAFTYDNKDQSWTADNAGQLLMATIARTILDRWH